jgi:hypothetical protein
MPGVWYKIQVYFGAGSRAGRAKHTTMPVYMNARPGLARGALKIPLWPWADTLLGPWGNWETNK